MVFKDTASHAHTHTRAYTRTDAFNIPSLNTQGLGQQYLNNLLFVSGVCLRAGFTPESTSTSFSHFIGSWEALAHIFLTCMQSGPCDVFSNDLGGDNRFKPRNFGVRVN